MNSPAAAATRVADWARRAGARIGKVFLERDPTFDTRARIDAPLLSPGEIAELARLADLVPSAVVRDVHDHHAGDWSSRWLGRGLDFEESRPYSPGDDTRDMDWRTTARTGRPYLKIYREERQPALHLVVDRSASMRFGTRRRLKVAQAARIACLLAMAAAGRNGIVGATLWDDEDDMLPTGHGRIAALGLIDRLNAATPPKDPAPGDAVRFADRLARLEAGLPRGARVVVLSDFTWLAPALAPSLARLAARYDLRAMHIVDAAERALPDVGLVLVHDMASRQDRWLDTAQPIARHAHASALSRHLETRRDILSRAGVRSVVVDSATDDLVALLARG